MICPNCGGWNDNKADVCRHCGARVQIAYVPEEAAAPVEGEEKGGGE